MSLSNHIRHARILFKHAEANGLVQIAVKFGSGFDSPTKDALRRLRQSKPQRMFEPAEIRQLLSEARPSLKAMILLAANCGFGNTDCALLPKSAVDLKGGWVTFPRPKTGVERKAALWSETSEALIAAAGKRPIPKDTKNDHLFFISRNGVVFVRTGENGTNFDAIATGFAGLLVKTGVPRGRGFYALRHGFQTVADGMLDPVAVRHVMGHAAPASDMSAVYRERIDDSRLRAVADHVHAWLWPAETVKE